MKILIVDDREENLYMLESLLKGSGYEVVSAVNGAEALEKIRSDGADMIISDVLMPVMDGFKLCKEVQADNTLKDTPFVFYTSEYKNKRDEELALKLGADRYILKPMEPDKLLKILQDVMRDVEKGEEVPKKPVSEKKEEEILKLYSERLVEKLEKQMIELEREVANRKRAEEVLQKRTYDLGKRVKELDCLYSISKLVDIKDISLHEIFQGVVEIIPPGWQYPEITCARIIIEKQKCSTDNFKETEWKQANDIVVHGKKIGTIEVYYLEEKPEIDVGPFLKEERDLINAIAERMGRITERKKTEEALQKAHEDLEAQVEERTNNLKEKTEKLERMNKVFVDRELKMIVLKDEIKELKAKIQEGGG